MRLPTAARPVVLVLGLAFGVAACGGGDGGGATDAAPTTTAAPPTTAPATTAPGRVIRVSFADGAVTGTTREQVRRGENVRLVVTSDVADEVHVHGYDLRADVAAGGTAEISFTADIPGVFEVELEDRHRRLLTLEVQG